MPSVRLYLAVARFQVPPLGPPVTSGSEVLKAERKIMSASGTVYFSGRSGFVLIVKNRAGPARRRARARRREAVSLPLVNQSRDDFT